MVNVGQIARRLKQMKNLLGSKLGSNVEGPLFPLVLYPPFSSPSSPQTRKPKMKNTTAYFKEILEKDGAESVFTDMLNSIDNAIQSWTVLGDALSEAALPRATGDGAAAGSEYDPQVKVEDVDFESGQMVEVAAAEAGCSEASAAAEEQSLSTKVLEKPPTLLELFNAIGDLEFELDVLPARLAEAATISTASGFSPQGTIGKDVNVASILEDQLDRLEKKKDLPSSQKKEQLIEELMQIFVHNFDEIMKEKGNQEIFKALAKMSERDSSNLTSEKQVILKMGTIINFEGDLGDRFSGLKACEISSAQDHIVEFIPNVENANSKEEPSAAQREMREAINAAKAAWEDHGLKKIVTAQGCRKIFEPVNVLINKRKEKADGAERNHAEQNRFVQFLAQKPKESVWQQVSTLDQLIEHNPHRFVSVAESRQKHSQVVSYSVNSDALDNQIAVERLAVLEQKLIELRQSKDITEQELAIASKDLEEFKGRVEDLEKSNMQFEKSAKIYKEALAVEKQLHAAEKQRHAVEKQKHKESGDFLTAFFDRLPGEEKIAVAKEVREEQIRAAQKTKDGSAPAGSDPAGIAAQGMFASAGN